MMRRDRLDHCLRAAEGVTGHRRFVLVGSAVVLVRCRNIPGDMLLTPEADLYVPGVRNSEDLSDAIEASIGQGSSFHRQFGYYCDGVSPGTAVMPTDWEARTIIYESTGCPGVTAVVPDPDDLALSKAVAWRDKDKAWLKSGVRAKLFSLHTMAARLVRMPDRAPAIDEMTRRLAWLAAECGVSLTHEESPHPRIPKTPG
ncbi:hypothetical protein MKL09_18260 [Methylobacterium sp. J-048]|uniref:DUF6036 family nucleotidyltransferase n=1 Tax=Methylobacterium sp. J-048 TaxID=2836635 RepID=UPI001FB94EFD|nr:DUF6036 family nucleotidyltransferase [Methylobacterium sp. J-048]MCJ2058485.1 hypothetical protein [Methylobacterium sp. J-048]